MYNGRGNPPIFLRIARKNKFCESAENTYKILFIFLKNLLTNVAGCVTIL